MNPRTQYQMTEEDLEKLLAACKPTPAMWGSGGAPLGPSQQENANRAWEELGKRMGFDSTTVQPMHGMGPRNFTAVPSETDEQKALRLERQSIEARVAKINQLKAEIEERENILKEIGADL